MTYATKITPEAAEAMLVLREAGATQREVAAKFGVALSAAQRHLKHAARRRAEAQAIEQAEQVAAEVKAKPKRRREPTPEPTTPPEPLGSIDRRALAILNGFGPDTDAGYLDERDAWRREDARRAITRGITRDTPQANFLMSMGDDEYAAHVRRRSAAS